MKLQIKKTQIEIIHNRFFDAAGTQKESFGVKVNGLPKHEYLSASELFSFLEGIARGEEF